jgi:hypothetical protein
VIEKTLTMMIINHMSFAFCLNSYGKVTGGGNDELKADGGKSMRLLKLAKQGLF